MLFEAYKNFCNNFSSKCITQLEEKSKYLQNLYVIYKHLLI